MLPALRKARDGRHDFGDRHAGRGDGAIAKRIVDEAASLVRIQTFACNNFLQLLRLAASQKRLPLGIDL